MEALSSSISSRSLLTSSCICCLSCWSFPMCSAVFCSVTAFVIWRHRVMKQVLRSSSNRRYVNRLTFDCDFSAGTRLPSVLKPIFMLHRLFCSADMWVVRRFCHTPVKILVIIECFTYWRKKYVDVLQDRTWRVGLLIQTCEQLIKMITDTNLIVLILYQSWAADDDWLRTGNLIKSTRRPLTGLLLTVNCTENNNNNNKNRKILFLRRYQV